MIAEEPWIAGDELFFDLFTCDEALEERVEVVVVDEEEASGIFGLSAWLSGDVCRVVEGGRTGGGVGAGCGDGAIESDYEVDTGGRRDVRFHLVGADEEVYVAWVEFAQDFFLFEGVRGAVGVVEIGIGGVGGVEVGWRCGAVGLGVGGGWEGRWVADDVAGVEVAKHRVLFGELLEEKAQGCGYLLVLDKYQTAEFIGGFLVGTQKFYEGFDLWVWYLN